MPPKKAATAKKPAATASHPPYQGESIPAVARFDDDMSFIPISSIGAFADAFVLQT